MLERKLETMAEKISHHFKALSSFSACYLKQRRKSILKTGDRWSKTLTKGGA